MFHKDNIKKGITISSFLLIIYFLYKIHHILVPFVISAIIIFLVSPLVNFISSINIKNQNISRGASVLIIYILFFGLMSIIGVSIFPLLYVEGIKIASEIPKQINDLRSETIPNLLDYFQGQFDTYGIETNLKLEFDKFVDSLLSSGEESIKSIPKLIQEFISGFFDTLTSIIVIIIFSAFVLIDLPKIKESFLNLIPVEYHSGLKDLADSINRDLNGAIRGQLLICILNGLLTTIGLLILNVNYALTIGLIAGIFSLIPIFGTIFSTIPAVIVGITQSWLTVIEILILIIIIHLIEANFLNPKIMGTSVELHPAIIIFSIFVGEHLFGIAGLLLSVPIVAILRSIILYIYKRFYLDNDNQIINTVEEM